MSEPLYIQPKTAEEYKQSLPTRLGVDRLEKRAIVNFMMRCQGGVGPEAYLGPVLIKNIRRLVGVTGLTLAFLNQDLQSAENPVGGFVRENIWKSSHKSIFQSPDGAINTTTREGYFLPYESQMIDTMHAAIASSGDIDPSQPQLIK